GGAMDAETLLRRAAQGLHPAVPPRSSAAFRTGLKTNALPANSFLQFGGGEPLGVDVPPWARGMVTRARPLAGSNGLAASILNVEPLTLISVRRGAAGAPIALIGAPADPPKGTAGSTLFHFGAGSIWIAASLLSAQAPPDGFMGVKVASLDLVV